MQNTPLREYDENVKEYYNEKAGESIDPIVIFKLRLLEYLYNLSNLHKKKSDKEYHKSDNVHDQVKRKHNKKHHKRDHVDDRPERKHNRKRHDEVHHKREHNDNRLKRKHDKNYYPGTDFFNSFKSESSKNKNCASLENIVEYENRYLSKEDGLENKNYTCFDHLCNEDFPEEKHNTIAKEEFSKETYKNQVDEVTGVNCKTTVTSEMIPLCENIPYTSEITVEPVIIKVPVVLTECTITITVESSLKLEDVVLGIKHIRKNVYLNQCELIPNAEDGEPNTGILFVNGFIKKNIEYTTKDHNGKGVLYEKVKHVTVRVPFKCTTRVTFKTHPKIKPNTNEDEVEILQTSINVFNLCEEDKIGRDFREQSYKMIEFFNEKVFCELISAEIVESEILENPINKECKIPLEQGAHDITEKVVLFVTIKLLQNQNIEISKL